MFVNELYQGGIRALLDWDNTLFDNMSLPDDVALDDVVDHIIFKYGDAPLFSPDPAVMKYYITKWSARRLPQWVRFKNAIEEEYNPLENYDRTEETTDYFTHGHKVVTNDDLTHGLTTEGQISADNASTYQPDSKAINSGKDQRDLDETHSGQDKRDYNSHIHGNIGVTTSQQMLTSELEVIPKLDLLDFIADDFHSEFNIMIYN